MSASVLRSVFWAPVVAQRTTATGVRDGIPAASSSAAMALSLTIPISMTFVPGVAAIARKSGGESALPGSSCPVKIVSTEL